MPWYSSIHRGKGFKSEISSEAYDDAVRSWAVSLAWSVGRQVVIFVKNTTEAVNKAARRIGLNKEDVVLLSLMEHHSNDLPWRAEATVVHLALRSDGSLDMDDVRAKFEQYGERIKLVAVSGASNVTGYINPPHGLAEKAHARRADPGRRAQLAPHRGIISAGRRPWPPRLCRCLRAQDVRAVRHRRADRPATHSSAGRCRNIAAAARFNSSPMDERWAGPRPRRGWYPERRRRGGAGRGDARR